MTVVYISDDPFVSKRGGGLGSSKKKVEVGKSVLRRYEEEKDGYTCVGPNYLMIFLNIIDILTI